MSEIRLENISYTYSRGTPYEKKALDGVSLTFRDGIVTGLMGHTGSGKSTLVNMLNGLLRPDEGRVFLDGVDIWEKPKEIRSVRFRVGLVMQYPEYQLFDETVRSDIAFGPKNMGLSEEEIALRTSEAMRFVGLSEDLLDKSPFELSGGQKRRAAMAGVIAMRPDVLVLDEPAAGLDPEGRESILTRIKAYARESGTTVIIVSHSMEDMAVYCDRIAVISDGKLKMDGTREEVFRRRDELVGIGLGVPLVTEIALELKRLGVPLKDDIFTVKYAAEAILSLVGKN